MSGKNSQLSWLVAYGDVVTLLICLLITIVVVLQGQSEEDIEWLADQILEIGLKVDNNNSSDYFSIHQRAGSFVVLLSGNSFGECKSEVTNNSLKTEISELGLELLTYIKYLENIEKPHFIKDSIYTEIVIEGHTDNKIMNKNEICIHDNNWQLSAARAFETMINITSNISNTNPLTKYSKAISIRGYADKKPICKEDSNECRAINRRIEIIFTARLM